MGGDKGASKQPSQLLNPENYSLIHVAERPLATTLRMAPFSCIRQVVERKAPNQHSDMKIVKGSQQPDIYMYKVTACLGLTYWYLAADNPKFM